MDRRGQKNVEKAIKATEEINGAFQNAYLIATKGAADCSAKVTEATRTNTVMAFDVANELMAVKSLPEIIELSSTSARKQFDALAAQNQELLALTQQLANEAIKPLSEGLPKAFNAGASVS